MSKNFSNILFVEKVTRTLKIYLLRIHKVTSVILNKINKLKF